MARRWDCRMSFTNLQHPESRSALYTELTVHCFPLFRCQIVVQHHFKPMWKMFSIASPNSCHAMFFALATAIAAFGWACRYPNCPIQLLPQLDIKPHCQSSLLGFSVATSTGTYHLAAAARVGNGSTNMVYSNSVSPVSFRTLLKLSRR